jgi:hypothetical protein
MPMIPAILLILAAVAYRIVTGLAIISGSTWLSNFAPLAAIALCGALYFPPKLKFTLPLVASSPTSCSTSTTARRFSFR